MRARSVSKVPAIPARYGGQGSFAGDRVVGSAFAVSASLDDVFEGEL